MAAMLTGKRCRFMMLHRVSMGSHTQVSAELFLFLFFFLFFNFIASLEFTSYLFQQQEVVTVTVRTFISWEGHYFNWTLY